jgi:hypothetical protein
LVFSRQPPLEFLGIPFSASDALNESVGFVCRQEKALSAVELSIDEAISLVK